MATSHIFSSSIGRGTHSVTSLEKIGQLRFFENATWMNRSEKLVSKKNEDDGHAAQELGNKKGTITSFVLSDYVLE